METIILDGLTFREMIINGTNNLRNNQVQVNELNVFPVADGDTGLNMRMTMEGALNALLFADERNLGIASNVAARNSLLEARGNSGVILSQFLRGIANGLAKYSYVNPKEFALALKSGVECAYTSIVNPVEGTILTVAREATEYVLQNIESITSFQELFDFFIKEMKASLERTPELLPVLKESGVLDSGGVGLYYIMDGMRRTLYGEKISSTESVSIQKPSTSNFGPDSALNYGYCTEFILQLQNNKVDIINFDLNEITNYLETIGDSIVAVKDDSIVKIHVHTKTPGLALSCGQQYGEFVTIKIENMEIQHEENIVKNSFTFTPEKEKKKIGYIVVANGEGIIESFNELGADYVVVGGQTMNPSIEDFIKAYDSISADHIIVFPNNSNIILAAKQSASLYDKAIIHVAESKTIVEGYSAFSMVDPENEDIESVMEEINNYMNINTAMITTSIRDTSIKGLKIKKGSYIGIFDDDIKCSEDTKIKAFLSLLSSIPDIDDYFQLTIFYGIDVTDEDLDLLKKQINEHFPNLEIGLINGKQPIYSFIIGIE